MFDRTTNYYSPSKKIDVHEYRAPTAETAKLLNELQKEATDKIFDSFILKNAEFGCEVAVFTTVHNLGKRVFYKMVINKTPIQDSFDLEFINEYDRDEIIVEVFSELSKHIAEKIFKENWQQFNNIIART